MYVLSPKSTDFNKRSRSVRMRFLNERMVTPPTSTSTISNAPPGASNVASTRASSSGTRTVVTRQTLQPRNDDVQERGDLLRALEEHVEVAARGVHDVFSGLELDLVQAHSGQPIGERSAVVGKVAREAFEGGRARRRPRMDAPHPQHVLACQRDDEVGGIELCDRRLAAPVVG